MKKKYTDPDMEIVLLDEVDIITTSDGVGGSTGIGTSDESENELGDV